MNTLAQEYRYLDFSPTTFVIDRDTAYLKELLGLDAGVWNSGGSSRIEGLFTLHTSLGVVRWRDFKMTASEFGPHTAWMAFAVYGGQLRYETCWSQCDKTGVWKRQDILKNEGNALVTIFRGLSKFVFAPGSYEVYSQESKRKMENQGAWLNLHHGSMGFGSEGGLTCLGSTPFAAIRPIGERRGIAVHVVPTGNWRIYVRSLTSASREPFAVIEAGLSDENLCMTLPAGGFIRFPEILLHELPGGEAHAGTPMLHRYLNERMADTLREAPVVYNTWFDCWDELDLARLRQQLQAAKDLGCEVFVVDAGWFGEGAGNWAMQVGDYREKQNGAFHGRMSDFAQEVRAAGMGFGLWVEPERIGPEAPVFKEHPEWFIPADEAYYYPDLTNKQVYDHILFEISRLIETYDLAWIKVDCNHELGIDPHSSEYFGYFTSLYALFRELRRTYPNVFFEGCAGGGMRLDIGSLAQFNGYFLSDNVNPLDVLSMSQQAMMRVNPGKLIKWTVLRSAGKAFPSVATPSASLSPSVVTWVATGRPWEGYVTTDLDFSARVSLPGIFGISGDMAGLPADAAERLKYHIAFYKKWRKLIAGSVGYLLTPPVKLNDYKGWTAIQLQDSQGSANLLFVYRLEDARHTNKFRLKGLEPDCLYDIFDEDAAVEEPPFSQSGKQLMADGIQVRIDKKFKSKVLVIRPSLAQPLALV
jgi:alpha-galactosidase